MLYARHNFTTNRVPEPTEIPLEFSRITYGIFGRYTVQGAQLMWDEFWEKPPEKELDAAHISNFIETMRPYQNYCMTRGQKLVAMASADVLPPFAELSCGVVAPDERGHKIGPEFLGRIEKRLAEQGVSEAFLTARTEGLIPHYEDCGYQLINEQTREMHKKL